MPASLHLVVAFSDHGYGHVAQGAPVVNALRARLAALPAPPELRLTLLTRAPERLLRVRVEGPFERIARPTGVDLVMDDALRVNPQASLEAYLALHGPTPDHWARRVGEEADFLAALPGGRPDLLLADVPYLPLAAAARLGVPGVACCSFDWELMFRHYCANTPATTHDDNHAPAARIADEIGAAYRTARLFLRPAPAVPGPDWSSARPASPSAPPGVSPVASGRVVPIGPSGRAGRCRRAELDERFPDLVGRRLLLVTFGGIDTPVDLSAWPRLPDWRIVVRTAEEAARHPDAIPQDPLLALVPFGDLAASVDVLLVKPGYGTFVEAAAAGVPVLYIPRGDWPEEPYLTAFLHAHTRALEVPAGLLASRAGGASHPRGLTGAGLGDAIPGLLDDLLAQPARPPAALTGPAEATGHLMDLLGLG